MRALTPDEAQVIRWFAVVLLVSGGDDRVWATGRMCRMIVDRMSRHGRADDVKHLHYPQAGHMLFPYVRPSDAMFPEYPMDLGGTDADNLAAHTAARVQLVAHPRGRQGLGG